MEAVLAGAGTLYFPTLIQVERVPAKSVGKSSPVGSDPPIQVSDWPEYRDCPRGSKGKVFLRQMVHRQWIQGSTQVHVNWR